MVLGILMMLLQQQPATPAMPASGLAKVEVTPQTSEIQVGQAIQFHARAVDSSGHEVPGARVQWLIAASFGNGTATVDSTGLVKAGYKGRVSVTAIATIPGRSGRGIGRLPLRVVPAAASRLVIDPDVSRVLVGTRLSLTATAYSDQGDRRTAT